MTAWVRGFLSALPWVGVAFALTLAHKARADVYRQWGDVVTQNLTNHLRETARANRAWERQASRGRTW
jgi:hypothetical protein